MKKMMLISVGALMLLSSCGTYAGAGAYTGATFGSIIGSAIGGISGGPRGSDVGTLIGMASGAAVGAAIGQAADNAQQQQYAEARAQRQQRINNRTTTSGSQRTTTHSDSGYDGTNSGDDRLYGFGEDLTTGGSSVDYVPDAGPALEIRHARLMDQGRDGVLSRGEEARVVFEIYNNSAKTIYRVQPSVAEVTGNRHIHVSENILVESILPGKGIRYTAIVRADDRLKDGQAVIRIGVLQNNREVASQTRDFTIRTTRR